ncbi:MAG: hypothetical protein AAFO82_17015, partial [Bacteroidota bacterium]
MKKTILFYFFSSIVTIASTQGLQQPNYQQYLANSINLSGLSLLGEQPYFGIGKKQLLENLPPAFTSSALLNYAPALRKSSPFGIIYPSAFLIQSYSPFHSKIDINGSHFGEWDATTQIANHHRDVYNNLIVHIAQNN